MVDNLQPAEQKRIRVIQGPNLNLLGQRDPALYGTQTLAELHQQLTQHAKTRGIKLLTFQSNHEGDLIDMVHLSMGDTAGLIINAGGYTHTSIALADALDIYPHPIVEVHLSDITNREPFRHHSYISPHAARVITGKGAAGYTDALDFLASLPQP